MLLMVFFCFAFPPLFSMVASFSFSVSDGSFPFNLGLIQRKKMRWRLVRIFPCLVIIAAGFQFFSYVPYATQYDTPHLHLRPAKFLFLDTCFGYHFLSFSLSSLVKSSQKAVRVRVSFSIW